MKDFLVGLTLGIVVGFLAVLTTVNFYGKKLDEVVNTRDLAVKGYGDLLDLAKQLREAYDQSLKLNLQLLSEKDILQKKIEEIESKHNSSM